VSILVAILAVIGALTLAAALVVVVLFVVVLHPDPPEGDAVFDEWDQVLDRWEAMTPDERHAFLFGEPTLSADDIERRLAGDELRALAGQEIPVDWPTGEDAPRLTDDPADA
jgi:hypothetical protein